MVASSFSDSAWYFAGGLPDDVDVERSIRHGLDGLCEVFDPDRVWNIFPLDRAEPYLHRGGLAAGLGDGRLASAASGQADRACGEQCGGELSFRFHRELLSLIR
jgi:hypothetical protein